MFQTDIGSLIIDDPHVIVNGLTRLPPVDICIWFAVKSGSTNTEAMFIPVAAVFLL